MCDEEARKLELRVAQLETKLVTSAADCDRLQRERQCLERRLQAQQERCALHERREFEAVTRVRDSIQLAETALLEKEKAQMRQKGTLKDVDRLQCAIQSLLEEAGRRTKHEVENVKRQYNDNLSGMVEEIRALEATVSEKQALLERTQREKTALESELDKVYAEGMSPSHHRQTQQQQQQGSLISSDAHMQSTFSCSISEMAARLQEALKQRDEALARLQSINNNNRHNELAGEQLLAKLQSEVDALKERVATGDRELIAVSDSRLRLEKIIDDQKLEMQKLQQAADMERKSHVFEMSMLKSQLTTQKTELQTRLQCLEESNHQSIQRLNEMITLHQKAASKWKEECLRSKQDARSTMSSLQCELQVERRQVDQLTTQIRSLRDKLVQVHGKSAINRNELTRHSTSGDYLKTWAMSADVIRASASGHSGNDRLFHSASYRRIADENDFLKSNSGEHHATDFYK